MAHPRRTGRWQFSVSPRLALPECAAALSLRANVTMPRLAAPDGDVEALAEVAAGGAAARALGSRLKVAAANIARLLRGTSIRAAPRGGPRRSVSAPKDRRAPPASPRGDC